MVRNEAVLCYRTGSFRNLFSTSILFLHPLGMKLTHSFLLKNLSKLFITVVIDILSAQKEKSK